MENNIMESGVYYNILVVLYRAEFNYQINMIIIVNDIHIRSESPIC